MFRYTSIPDSRSPHRLSQHRQQHVQPAALPADHGTPRRRSGVRRQQRLHLQQHRPRALQPGEHGTPGDVAPTLGQEQRRRVRHFRQAAIGHLEHADLVGGAVAVLGGAQDARTGGRDRLRNTSPASTMCSSTRGPASEPSLVTWPTRISPKPRLLASRISSNPEDRTWLTEPGALSMVSSHMVWMLSITTRLTSASCSSVWAMSTTLMRRRELQAGRGQTEPTGAQPQLVHRLLARDVQHPPPGRRHRGRRLQHQRRLADAWIAADQHHRGRHQATAQHPVELGDAGMDARRRLG